MCDDFSSHSKIWRYLNKFLKPSQVSLLGYLVPVSSPTGTYDVFQPVSRKANQRGTTPEAYAFSI